MKQTAIVRFVRRTLKRVLVAALAALLLGAITLFICWRAFPFPADRLHQFSASPVVTDRHGSPLLQLVAADDQWRLPTSLDEMSPWLIAATIAVEDERFHSHLGVDPIAVLRAAGQNMLSAKVVSGASTITMQVCRMINERPRTLAAKIDEAFRAMQLEQLSSKDEILELYLNIAPYGGNLRGVEAASLRYFGKRAKDLSLPEAALLAGLPQSPTRLRPDRHPGAAMKRRETVLRRMAEVGTITREQSEEAARAAVVMHSATTARDLNLTDAKPNPAAHFARLTLAVRAGGGRTTLDLPLQREVERLVGEHAARLPTGTNAAMVVIDVSTGDVRAMVGSVRPDDPLEGQVNGAIALRSPGSALKPFVYAAAFESHRLNESSTLYDGPIERGGWTPVNFDRQFSGEVTAGDALRRSLNVPAILVAEGVGLQRCAGVMESAGIALPADAARRGGLAIVTGAIECSLVELTNAYATIGRGGVRKPVRLFPDQPTSSTPALSSEACAMIDDILSTAHRPPRCMEDRRAEDVPWFMWKTGTSSGRRDAWAVGHNRKVAIGVWIGRFNGAGDFVYSGNESAEPLLAKLFDLHALRNMDAPSRAASWPVVDPLPLPAELSPELRIVSPAAGSRFLAVGGTALIHPRAHGQKSPIAINRSVSTAAEVVDGSLTWFLNGRRLASGETRRLSLPPGTYELQCVTEDGRWTKTAFEVK